jgi:arylsulfatase A
MTKSQTISLDLAIRKGKWKYLDHKGSGGNNYNGGKLKKLYALTETAPTAQGQLYDMENDPGEKANLYFQHPEIVKELKQLLEESKKSDRSAPENR